MTVKRKHATVAVVRLHPHWMISQYHHTYYPKMYYSYPDGNSPWPWCYRYLTKQWDQAPALTLVRLKSSFTANNSNSEYFIPQTSAVKEVTRPRQQQLLSSLNYFTFIVAPVEGWVPVPSMPLPLTPLSARSLDNMKEQFGYALYETDLILLFPKIKLNLTNAASFKARPANRSTYRSFNNNYVAIRGVCENENTTHHTPISRNGKPLQLFWSHDETRINSKWSRLSFLSFIWFLYLHPPLFGESLICDGSHFCFPGALVAMINELWLL